MTDSALLDALARYLHGQKWEDVLHYFRPLDFVDDEPMERYINRDTFREMLTHTLRRKGLAP